MINYNLTPREIDVLKLICFTKEEISKRLNISNSTVGTHRKSILQKLLCSNRAQALVVALKNEIISLEDIKHE